jgi:hypothetical protein
LATTLSLAIIAVARCKPRFEQFIRQAESHR